MILIMIGALSLAQYIDPDFSWFGGVSCVVISIISLLLYVSTINAKPWTLLKKLDWHTVLFLIAIFILVTMLEKRGVITKLVENMELLSDLSPFMLFTAVVWVSVMVSAFIDNIPYITAMLPIVIGFSEGVEVPAELLVFGVLIGACLGGNITPIGASANIVAIGILGRKGHHPSFWEFAKIGLPFTLAATIPAYLLLWIIYK
jgi:Na+/H+ antiporter NhaD/arsenite permease-like protein